MSSIAAVNPYANHSQLSTLEQDVLWEFAKLNDKIKRASALARETAENPNESLLAELRTLEKRMGLVLTLVQASVWAVIVDSQAAEEARAQQLSESGGAGAGGVQGGCPRAVGIRRDPLVGGQHHAVATATPRRPFLRFLLTST